MRHGRRRVESLIDGIDKKISSARVDDTEKKGHRFPWKIPRADGLRLPLERKEINTNHLQNMKNIISTDESDGLVCAHAHGLDEFTGRTRSHDTPTLCSE